MESQLIDYKEILDFWFGSVEETVIPSEHRARVWFGDNPHVDDEMRNRFSDVHAQASAGTMAVWEETAHGQLALILLHDQFSRHLYRNGPKSFANDREALRICADAVDNQRDHELSLIERVFFYFPFLHAETLELQNLAVQCYAVLVELALPETKVVYDSFLRFSNHHYAIIKRFGRFPQRNQLLGRESSPEELLYLREEEES